jgi:hypothetical protein
MSESLQITHSKDALGREVLHAPVGASWKLERKRPNDFGIFQAISKLRTVYNESKCELDIFDRLALVSSGANKLFVEMKMLRDFRSSLVLYEPTDNSKSARAVFGRQLKMLKQQELVRKVPVSNEHITVKKHTYMINPTLLKCKDYDKAVELWESLE